MNISSKTFIRKICILMRIWRKRFNFAWILDYFPNRWFLRCFMILINICITIKIKWNLSLFLCRFRLLFHVSILFIFQWLLWMAIILCIFAWICLNIFLLDFVGWFVIFMLISDWSVFISINNFRFYRLWFH
jgi:hypothetical protein